MAWRTIGLGDDGTWGRVLCRVADADERNAVFGDNDAIWDLVDQCHHETTKQPHEELCRFCENRCNSWKKLTVHLAKHMEQVSMPAHIACGQE